MNSITNTDDRNFVAPIQRIRLSGVPGSVSIPFAGLTTRSASSAIALPTEAGLRFRILSTGVVCSETANTFTIQVTSVWCAIQDGTGLNLHIGCPQQIPVGTFLGNIAGGNQVAFGMQDDFDEIWWNDAYATEPTQLPSNLQILWQVAAKNTDAAVNRTLSISTVAMVEVWRPQLPQQFKPDGSVT